MKTDEGKEGIRDGTIMYGAGRGNGEGGEGGKGK